MEYCLKLVPRNCYNKYSSVVLALFVATGVVLVAIARDYESKSSLDCDLTSSLFKGKYIEKDCLTKYKQEFFSSLRLHKVILLNFGVVILVSIVYGCLVKCRVDHIANNPNAEETELLSPDAPVTYRGSNRCRGSNRYCRYRVFWVYIIHLIVCRIILPQVIYFIFLFNSSKFPTDFECPLPNMKTTTSTFHENVTRSTTNSSFVNCIYSTNEQDCVNGFITVNVVFCAVTLGEILYLSWSALKDPKFKTDQEFIGVYILRNRTKTFLKRNKKVKKIQHKSLLKTYGDYGGDFMENREVGEIFTNFEFSNSRKTVSNPKKEFAGAEYVELKPQKPKSLKSTAELFQAAKTGEEQPRTVLVVGGPGMGKTLLTEKIFNEWQQNKERSGFWHGKIVLLIKFQDFIQKDKTNPQEILSKAHGVELLQRQVGDVLEYVTQNPSNFIIVFDSLEELQFKKIGARNENIVNAKEGEKDAHISQIFEEIMRGKYLYGVTVLTTSRPTTEHQLPKEVQFNQEVEILGFNEEQVEKYVRKFCCKDTWKSPVIWDIIRDSTELLGFCYMPVISYIVCLTLYEKIDSVDYQYGSYSKIHITMTELYKRAMRILLFKHNLKSGQKSGDVPKDYLTISLPDELKTQLTRLNVKARDGMKIDEKEKQDLIFHFESNDEFILELSDSGVFNQLKHKTQKIFSFVHPSLQKFLAAQQVVADIDMVGSFLEENIDDPKWHLVIQFVAGLLGKKLKESSEKGWKDLSKKIEEVCNRFQDLMPKKRRIDKKGLLVIKSVWEMQEDRVMKKISSFASEDDDCLAWFASEDDDETFTLSGLNIALAESIALFKFLSHIKKLKKLQIIDCTMTNIAIHELAAFLKKDNYGLESNNCKLTKLDVSVNSLTTEGVKYLSDALKNNNCKRTEVSLRIHGLSDECVKSFCELLKNTNCKFTKLYLIHSKLTLAENVEYLSGAMKSHNSELSELDSSGNSLLSI